MIRPEKFTEQAREVIAASQEIAIGYRHSQWDVEHLFLALLRQEGGIALQILEKLGVNIEALKGQVQATLDNAPQMNQGGAQIYATPRIASLMQSAAREAEQFKDNFISVEHLLIALASESSGETATILKEFGIDKEKIYQSVKDIRGGHRAEDPEPKASTAPWKSMGVTLPSLLARGNWTL